MSKDFDRYQFTKNKAEAANKLKEQFGVKKDEIQALITGSLQGIQNEIWKLEAIMPPEDLALATELSTGSVSRSTIDAKTIGFSPERKKLVTSLLLMIFLMFFLISCGAPVDAITPAAGPIVTEVGGTGVTTTETAPAPGETIPPTPTEIPFSELEIDYGRYAGDEAEVDPYIEKAWSLINSFVIQRGIAAPTAVEIIDVSKDNIIVEVLPQGRTDDYPEGTSFTISFVDGHQGETLSVSIDGANAAVGGGVVELAIGENGLSVGLNAEGKAIAHVDKATGQWVAGAAELADEVFEVPYFEMTPAERLAESESLVEAASGYSGEVYFDIDFYEEKGQHFPFYWSPTHGGWKTSVDFSSGGVPESSLDRRGESFPSLTIPGYENPDGSLVMVDPKTGIETTFPATIFIPGFGDVSMRDLMTMGQDKLGDKVVEAALTSIDSTADETVYTRTEASAEHDIFIPGFTIGENLIYPVGVSGATGPNVDIPEVGQIIGEWPADSFAVPIFSPETGSFMFFLNIQRGRLASVLEFIYSSTGVITFDFARGTGFGSGENGFGVLIEHPDPNLSHYEGGHSYLLGDEPGIGEASEIQRILNASTEDEILDILNDLRLIFSVPFRIMHPGN